jgi:hypothetical protein
VQYDLANSTWCMSSGFSGSPAHTTPPQPLGFTDTTSHEVSVGLTSLSAGSQYCAQVIASNGSGQGNGGVVTWNQGLPGASTTDAFSTGTVTATVDGAVNPAGQSTDYKVLYDVASSDWCSSSGASGSPAFATTPQILGFTDNSSHDVSVPVTGLTEGTSYCAELQATNGGGSAHGFQVQWTQGAPTVDTTGAESTGPATATVFGDVNPAGQTTKYQVEYAGAGSNWCTSGGFFGSPDVTTTLVTLSSTDGTSHAVSVGLTSLTPDASYCGEVVATNNDGTGRGSLAFWSQPSSTLTVHKSGSGSGGVTSSPAGINCGATCAAQFDHGTQITLTATPASGSTFAGWSGGGCSGTGTCKVTLNADTTVTATFDTLPPPQHTLTVSKAGSGSGSVTSSPAGINCGSTCAHAFTAGTQVTLTAAATSGSTFAGWSGGGCSGTGTCKVPLNSDTTVTATFNPATAVPHLLTVTSGGDGTGSVTSSPAGIDCGSTCSHAFVAGSLITLTATADSGSTFTGWSGGGCSGNGNCVVTLNSDTTVTATFTTNSPPPPPPTMCIVPKLKGKTVAAAKRAIKKAHCSVGKITKVASSPKNRGKVVSQSPKPGKHLKKGSKVALKVGK